MLIHTDRHLNVFINYGDTHHLENNLTKAFIHTLSFLDTAQQLHLLADWLEEPRLNQLDVSTTDIHFGLQIQPPELAIENIPMANRLQLGICPTGEAWNENLLNLGALPADPTIGIQMVYDALRSDQGEAGMTQEESVADLKKRAAEEYDVLMNRSKQGSIPDAWIVVYEAGEPTWCIIVENKWYDLNPHQLRNHREKALAHAEAKTKIRSFAQLYDRFRSVQERTHQQTLIPHFLEYLSLTGNEAVHRFYPADVKVIREAKSLQERDFYANLLYRKFFKVLDVFAKNEGYVFDARTRRMQVDGVEQFNFVFEFDQDTGHFRISSEIGVKNQNVNKRILPRLLDASRSLQSDIEQLYPNSVFQRFIRLNKFNTNHYFHIAQYPKLGDYLAAIKDVPITRSKVSARECYDKLTALGVAAGRIQHVSYAFHKLEYLRILDHLDIQDYVDKPNHDQLFADLKNLVEQHLRGIHRFEVEWQAAD